MPTITPERILKLGSAYRASKALLSAVELDVFTALADGPLDLEALRCKIGIDRRGARDFLDALVAIGLLDRDDANRYVNTPEAAMYLDRRKTTYMGAELEFLAHLYGRWSSLTPALTTGRPQSGAGAAGMYPARYADPRQLETFVTAMTAGSLPAAKALAAKFAWQNHTTMIDIGAAQGCVPVAIAQAHRHMTGGGFDLPALQPLFRNYVQEHGLSERLGFYAGDFFSDTLPRADVLVMGRVLHNWDLVTKKMLLSKAYDALPTGGALIVYERLIDNERRVSAAGLLASLNMLIMTQGGFDFSAADCTAWMEEVGFRKIGTETLTDELSMVVGYK